MKLGVSVAVLGLVGLIFGLVTAIYNVALVSAFVISAGIALTLLLNNRAAR